MSLSSGRLADTVFAHGRTTARRLAAAGRVNHRAQTTMADGQRRRRLLRSTIVIVCCCCCFYRRGASAFRDKRWRTKRKLLRLIRLDYHERTVTARATSPRGPSCRRRRRHFVTPPAARTNNAGLRF